LRLENGWPVSGWTAGSLRIRSSTGSMRQACASSSMADSSANIPGHSPGARIQDGVGTSSRTTRWVVRRWGAAYMCLVATADCSANSLSVEVWSITSWHSATSLPSRPEPSRTR